MLMQFRRKGDVDVLIRKLSNRELVRGLNKKELSSDDLKQLGDLYLLKGDTEKAIEYLFRAAEELSVNHPNKAIAVYKQILKIRPAAIEACEKIIGVLCGEKLVAEQIKYLMFMARFYESKNDISKTASTYRRILDLDPSHEAAIGYFGRGKVD